MRIWRETEHVRSKMADDEMYLDNLKEFIIDEERIVTYKWLSRTLSVNVNQAKQMLYAFIQQQQQEKADSLCIIYTVGGLIRDKNGNLIQKYLFSHEEDLKDIKQCYDKITSLHVYSVQKTKPKDSNVLYLADYDLQKQNLDSPNRWSNITFKSITKRNTEIPEETVAKNESRNEETRKPISNGFQKQAQNKVQVQPSSAPSTSAKNSKSKPSMKKGDVASFFARQAASKSKETVKSVNVKSEKEEQEKKEIESKNAIEKEQNKSDSTSFNKNVKNEKKPVKDEKESVKNVKEKDVETKEKEDEQKTKVVDQADEDFETKKSSPQQGEKKSRKTQKQNKNEKENQEGKETKSKKRKTSSKKENEESKGKTKTQRKKRKRVKNFSDTSSEEEDNSVNTKQSSSGTDTTPIPDQQAQDIKPETQKIRRRKRVLKSKTYLNDDGYMVTERVYESESASSEDEQKKPTTKVEPNKPALKDSIQQPPKKKPANKVTKQASLTSFFKRT